MSTISARLGMVAVTERWKNRDKQKIEPRQMLSICLGSQEGTGHWKVSSVFTLLLWSLAFSSSGRPTILRNVPLLFAIKALDIFLGFLRIVTTFLPFFSRLPSYKSCILIILLGFGIFNGASISFITKSVN